MADINQVAMHVILNSCDGRDKVDEAFRAMAKQDFDGARELLARAEDDILEAHKAQTEMIQAQAGGEDTEYSLLFIHAQDTLMTSDAQYRIAKNVIAIFEAQQKQIDELKEEKSR